MLWVGAESGSPVPRQRGNIERVDIGRLVLTAIYHLMAFTTVQDQLLAIWTASQKLVMHALLLMLPCLRLQ